ncbi:MAG: alginate lyase family protein [Burkholderiaceae bacterium]
MRLADSQTASALPESVEMAVGAPVDEAKDSIFLPPWSTLDDAALLDHFRTPRPAHFDLIVDEAECSTAKIEALMLGRFEFNGETYALAEPIAWLNNPSADVEWHILLHKFYYAPGLARAYLETGEERYADRWVGLIDSWMDSTQAGFIAADVTGRRVQNWIYSLRGFAWAGVKPALSVRARFFGRLLRSLHEQVEFLCAHLTPKRNHRTLELAAIFLAGIAFPEMKRAAHWREFGLHETLDNMRNDLLADGVHCELSTDYHHLALRNWLNLRRLAARHRVSVPAEMDRLLESALEFSMHVHKPDGVVPALSDGDPRSFLPLLAEGARLFRRDDMRWVASRGSHGKPPARTAVHFGASGYTVLRSGWGRGAADFGAAQYLVFDSGPLGEGNHGHFDCLNFELAAAGRSLIVDPGRYTYSEAPIGESPENWRVRFRGTAVHNTVCVDARNQTRYVPKATQPSSRHVPGSVRHKIAGPAPEATLLEFAQAPGLALLHGRAASHEYDALHDRFVVLVDGAYWIVSDALRAPTVHDYVLNFQLSAPAWGRTQLRQGRAGSDVQLSSPQLLIAQPSRPGTRVEVVQSWVSQGYGSKEPAPALRCAVHAEHADFDSVLVAWQHTAPRVAVAEFPVRGDGGASGIALRIEVESDGAVQADTWFHARGAPYLPWSICGLAFAGRWLHLRHGADGRVLRAVSHAGATLYGARGALALQVAQAWRPA